jgi:hypothetical protein
MFGILESKEAKNPTMLKFLLDLSHVIWLMPFEAAAGPSFIKAGWRGLQYPQASTMADPGNMVSCFLTDPDNIHTNIYIYISQVFVCVRVRPCIQRKHVIYIYINNVCVLCFILLDYHGLFI